MLNTGGGHNGGAASQRADDRQKGFHCYAELVAKQSQPLFQQLHIDQVVVER